MESPLLILVGGNIEATPRSPLHAWTNGPDVPPKQGILLDGWHRLAVARKRGAPLVRAILIDQSDYQGTS